MVHIIIYRYLQLRINILEIEFKNYYDYLFEYNYCFLVLRFLSKKIVKLHACFSL